MNAQVLQLTIVTPILTVIMLLAAIYAHAKQDIQEMDSLAQVM